MNESGPPEPQPSDNGSHPEGSDVSQRRLLAKAVRHSDLRLKDLWLHYFSLGGTAGEYEIDAYINASFCLPALQHDILAQSVNEMIDLLPPPPRAPFSDEADGGTAPTEARKG